MRTMWVMWILVVSLVCGGAGLANADVVQDPNLAINAVKGTFGTMKPGVDQLYDFRSGEWYTGTSVSLWQFLADKTPLATIRGGYGTDFKLYSSVQADLPALSRMFLLPILPDALEELGTASVLDSVWSAIGKYGQVGGFLGYDFDKQEQNDDNVGGVMVGVTLGARFRF